MTVRDAIIETSADDAAREVAGVPLLVRTVLVLQKAGIERVWIDGPAAIPSDARIRIPVVPGSPDGPRLVVGAGSVIDQPLVRAALEAGSVHWEREGARIDVRDATSAPRGAPPRAGILLPASAPAARIERTLLMGLENHRDGYLDRLIHRHASRPTTRLLLRTPLGPNHVTVAGVLIGIAGGWLVGAPTAAGVLAGVALLLVSGVLDCCDGEIARIKFSESRIGHLLDVTGDTVVHAALLGGIALRLAHEGAWPGIGTLVLLGIGVAGAFAAISWSEATETRRHRVPDAWENRVLDGVLSPLTTRDWYVFPIAFAVAGRLDLLVTAAAWGAQAFWIAVAVLVWRVLRKVPAA